MDISWITRNAYSILAFLLLILVITPSSSSLSPTDIVTKELLSKLCSQSVIFNHQFCVRWLTADHRTMSINIHGLIKLTVQKARAFGLKNQALMSDLARGSGKDKTLKEAYESCVSSHGMAIKELEKAQEFLRTSSFQQVYRAASNALDSASNCKDGFEGPSNEPSRVLNQIERFINICSIAMGFAATFS